MVYSITSEFALCVRLLKIRSIVSSMLDCRYHRHAVEAVES